MNGLRPVGRDEVAISIKRQQEENKKLVKKLVEKINATLLKGCINEDQPRAISVKVPMDIRKEVADEIVRMYDIELGDKGWKVKLEYPPSYRSEDPYFCFTPKWKDD
jgi:hypothetical protein